MTSATEEAAAFVDAEAAAAVTGPHLITLGDSKIVAPARDKEVLIAWGIDALLVFLVTAGIYVLISVTMPEPFSFAREMNALAAWPLVALVYGFATSYRRSFGQRIAGTRTLRIDNGGRLGFWRSGWMMVLRVMILPAAFLFCLCGGSTFGIKDRHVSIDALATGL